MLKTVAENDYKKAVTVSTFFLIIVISLLALKAKKDDSIILINSKHITFGPV